jgi:alkanesulfonate monooxygenase SsuD/methylene tetrahydromethanopterin reductase-like flavin-dependent oxidoreductase (luciferase family)
VQEPFASGSVSLRLYPHSDLPATRVVEVLREQARASAAYGFDGVMTSEHHGGFAGYLPNPLQIAGWLLEAMPTGWAAPCPLLLPLRPPALVAEETAWLAARFPGRVGLGVAAGALADDFDVMDVSIHDRTKRFEDGLAFVAATLTGHATGVLAGDRAIQHTFDQPVPLLSAAMGLTAATRAARLGVGLLLDSLTAPERTRHIVDAYRAAGGTGSCVLIRRVWVGAPPADLVQRQIGVYRTYATGAAQSHWEGDQLVGDPDGSRIAVALADVLSRTGADALNLRIQVPGVDPAAAFDQIAQVGDTVLPALRQILPNSTQ